ncbi:MAG: hypothetical protein OEW68_06860 [Gammaproteobacteria bacterium]|nr:hypothetical protein [Gammaproteobacteria bacterium]MDH4314544.1 hypothetical protein [Gammaproteobacteria bacterium]MDH5500438.1 hypothetical protein [Gammaproteobacteria bacterium]
MNCIPETEFPGFDSSKLRSHRFFGGWFPGVVIAAIAFGGLQGCGVSSSESAESPDNRNLYRIEFVVTPDRSAAGAHVSMNLAQSRGQLRQIRMQIDPQRIGSVHGDGQLQIEGETVTWSPARSGGSLRWFASLRHLRDDDSYDAYIDSEWALFRAEDIIPRATSRSLKGTSSDTWLRFELPTGWTSVTPYFGQDHKYRVDNPARRFDLPGGWIALGKIGVRNDTISGVRVKVAGPEGQSVRRMDTLALLHWTMPEMLVILPEFPQRLTVLSAGDPMWRGGLSGPKSLYIHSDRPLISENGTSTLLHEVFHVGFGPGAAQNADWIIEGLAEYYSIQFLARSGTISATRYTRALAMQAEWGESVSKICAARSSGARTARSVSILAALDNELRKHSKNGSSLDDVTRALASSDEKVSLGSLRDIATRLIGRRPDALAAKNLPGCPE